MLKNDSIDVLKNAVHIKK